MARTLLGRFATANMKVSIARFTILVTLAAANPLQQRQCVAKGGTCTREIKC